MARSPYRPQSSSPTFDVIFYTPWIGALLRPGTTLPTGGAETQILLLSRELAARGHSVAVIAFEVPGGLPAEVDGVSVLARPAYRAHRGLIGKFIELWWTWRSLWRQRAAVVVKRSAGIDVGLVGAFVRIRRQRFVFSSANVVDFNYATLMPARLYLLLYHLGVQIANTVVVQTDEQARLCERHFRRAPMTIRSIAEQPPAVEGAIVSGGDAFIWAGRLVDYKRPLAYVSLARSMPHARFVMVAVPTADESASKLATQVAEAATELPNLRLIDPLPRADLAELIGASVAVVNTADFEGMSNVALEGWARGIPSAALTHDPDGVIERHGLGGFAAGDPNRLRTVAESLWRREGRAEMAARCHAYVARYHAAAVVAADWEKALGLPCPGAPIAAAPTPQEPTCVE